ncbi:MAG: hypothetical protein OXH86_14410 [Acidimicrobiaceae bacterium]|nr:hypothetical protein [Acidimicrobiaceae bacterium]
MARFTMNLMLASGGHPWTVIRADDRQRCLAVPESASVHHAIEPRDKFAAGRVAAAGPAA